METPSNSSGIQKDHFIANATAVTTESDFMCLVDGKIYIKPQLPSARWLRNERKMQASNHGFKTVFSYLIELAPYEKESIHRSADWLEFTDLIKNKYFEICFSFSKMRNTWKVKKNQHLFLMYVNGFIHMISKIVKMSVSIRSRLFYSFLLKNNFIQSKEKINIEKKTMPKLCNYTSS